MGGISGVATVPSGSVVASAKNKTCDLEHVFGHDQRSSAQRARLQRRWVLSHRDHAVATRVETSWPRRVAAESWS